YKPDQGAGLTPGDRAATFHLINGVTLKGGYAGTGTPDPNARDIEVYETVLSGDLVGNDIEVKDLSDLWDEPTRAENSYHVVTASGTDENYVLDGFTIASGNVNRESLSLFKSGGGMFIDQGNLAISNCNFNNNSAWYAGGGIYIRAGSAVLTNCIFSANSSLHGGGLRNFGSLILTNCVFTGNWAAEGGGMENRGIMTLTNCTFSWNNAGSGGGMENHTWRGRPMLYNCMFNDNIGSWGGGMHNYYCSTAPKLINCSFKNNVAETGGGMCNLSSSPILVNCAFTYNSAFEGGGMSNLCGDEGPSEPVITKCAFIRNYAKDFGGGMFSSVGFQTLTNCIFSENLAEYGSGILVSQSVLTLISCTFGGNSADDNGTLCSWYGNSELRLSNCILWDDDNEIYNRDDSTIDITYSNVQGGWPGEGNIDADPRFVEPGYWDANGVWIDGDYHLLPDSPCIDTGDPNFMAEPNETDLDGKPRVLDGDNDSVLVVDMGAYEYRFAILAQVRIVPKTINLASKGKSITCYIWLPDEYDVADIEPNSVFFEDEIQPEQFSADQQKQVAMLRFSREDVQPILEVGDVELTITCQLTDGTSFEATDTIKVTDKAGK
ncbi:MAG: choice-of-anchor Q domain-containing protein, partial [Planctomycetota bacterium]